MLWGIEGPFGRFRLIWGILCIHSHDAAGHIPQQPGGGIVIEFGHFASRPRPDSAGVVAGESVLHA